MTPPARPGGQGSSVRSRRAERELFFWTVRETLKLVVWVALTIYFVVSLARGEVVGSSQVVDLTHVVKALLDGR